jgi:hypothetical protein
MGIIIGGNTLSGTNFNSLGETPSTPNMVTDGLVFHLDAGNNSSFINSSNYYDCGYGCQYYSSNPGCTNCNTQWKDMSGFGNDGTLVNGTSIVYDSNSGGGSMNFDGVNDRVQCENSISLNITASITMESWIRPTAYKTTGGGGGMIITKLSYYMELAGTGVIRVYFYDLNSQGYHNGTINIPLNSWSHVVGIRDQTNNSIKMYVNGVLDREITSITGNIRSNTTPVTIGSYSGSSYEYTGRISNVKIYNRSLSSQEVLQNFNNGRQRFGI